MTTAIIVLVLIALATQLSLIGPADQFVEPRPIDRDVDRQVGEVRCEPFHELGRAARDELAAEAERLAEFHRP